MSPSLWPGQGRWRGARRLTPWVLFLAALLMVRLSKGAGFADAYALLSRPFWPGSAQREWITAASDLEQRSRLTLLEQDNQRLRGMLSLQQRGSTEGHLAAAVISRSPRGWWQQLDLGKGSVHGISPGMPSSARWLDRADRQRDPSNIRGEAADGAEDGDRSGCHAHSHARWLEGNGRPVSLH